MFILKRYFMATILLFGAVSNVSCAEDGLEGAEEDVTIERKGSSPNQILAGAPLLAGSDTAIFSGAKHGFVGSYFSMRDGSAEVRFQRVLFMMEKADASPELLELVKGRLPGNRRLKKDGFTLPLIDQKGYKHEFEYIVDHANSFYTLNYRITSSSE